MELQFPFYQDRLKASNAVSRPLMFVSIWTGRWVNGQPCRLPVSQEEPVTAQVRASHGRLCSGHYLEAQPLRGLDTVQRSRVLDMRAGNRTACSLLIRLSIKRDGYTAVEPGAPFPFPHSRALQKQIRRERKSVQPVFPPPSPRCRTPPPPHPPPTSATPVLIFNRLIYVRKLSLILKLCTNPSVWALLYFGGRGGEPQTWLQFCVCVRACACCRVRNPRKLNGTARLDGHVQRPRVNANHLIKFEANCVMIDLPQPAMQNIMLPSLFASWAYCWPPLWHTEKNVQGTERVTGKQTVMLRSKTRMSQRSALGFISKKSGR